MNDVVPEDLCLLLLLLTQFRFAIEMVQSVADNFEKEILAKGNFLCVINTSEI